MLTSNENLPRAGDRAQATALAAILVDENTRHEALLCEYRSYRYNTARHSLLHLSGCVEHEKETIDREQSSA